MTEHKNVYVALAAAQAEMDGAVKGSVNPAFKSKYADLADVVQACRPALNKHGLAFYHQMVEFAGQTAMRTVIAHGASDTHVYCDVPLIVDRNNMQGMKSATTYAKRIGLESVTGIAPSDDDDGNAAAKAAPVRQAFNDARDDMIEDAAPANATPRQKAEAAAKMICDDFKGKGLKALDNRWDHWKKHIDRLASDPDYADLHAKVIDAYENRKNELTEERTAA